MKAKLSKKIAAELLQERGKTGCPGAVEKPPERYPCADGRQTCNIPGEHLQDGMFGQRFTADDTLFTPSGGGCWSRRSLNSPGTTRSSQCRPSLTRNASRRSRSTCARLLASPLSASPSFTLSACRHTKGNDSHDFQTMARRKVKPTTMGHAGDLINMAQLVSGSGAMTPRVCGGKLVVSPGDNRLQNWSDESIGKPITLFNILLLFHSIATLHMY